MNERGVLFYGHETAVDKVIKKRLGGLGTDKVAFKFRCDKKSRCNRCSGSLKRNDFCKKTK